LVEINPAEAGPDPESVIPRECADVVAFLRSPK